MTHTDRLRLPVLLAVIAALALAMTMLFSPLQAQEGSAPDKPRGLEATATHGQVVLTWDDPDDDTITGYVVLRRVRVNDTGGGQPHLHLPHQGHQRARGERALPLVPRRHSGNACTRQAHGPRCHGVPRLGDPHLGRPPGRHHHRLRGPAPHSRGRSPGPLQ